MFNIENRDTKREFLFWVLAWHVDMWHPGGLFISPALTGSWVLTEAGSWFIVDGAWFITITSNVYKEMIYNQTYILCLNRMILKSQQRIMHIKMAAFLKNIDSSNKVCGNFYSGVEWLAPGLNWNVFEWFVNTTGRYQSSKLGAIYYLVIQYNELNCKHKLYQQTEQSYSLL